MDAFLFKKHLEDDEHISMVVHKHWLFGLRYLFFPSVSFLASWLLLSIRHTQAMIVIIGLWSMVSLIWWLRNFFDYYLDAWIITDHGVIDLEWLGWFHRQSSRILYSDIQGVSTETHGIAGTLLRYGTVSVEKISTGAAVSLECVPRPRRVESVILKNMEAYLHTKNLKNAKHIEELLSQFVAEHIQEDGFHKGKKSSNEQVKDPSARPTKKSFTSSKVGGQ